MSDDAMQLLSDFRCEVPLPAAGATAAAYARVVNGASARPRRPARLAGRGRLSVALAASLLVFAAAAVAAVKEAPWWQSGEPPVDPRQVISVARDNLPAQVDVAHARTVVTAGDAALVAVPLDATGYCLIPAIDGAATLGAQCEYQVTNPERGDDDRTVSATRGAAAGAAPAWIVYGRITDRRAASIDLGPFALGLAPGGFFLTEVPPAEWPRLSGTATRGAILDGSGSVLRRGCVNWAIAPGGTTVDGEYPVPLWSDSDGGTCKPQKAPALPTVDLASAKKLFDVTLTQNYGAWKAGQTVSFEAARRSDGTSCLVAAGPQPSGSGPGFADGCGAGGGGTGADRPIDAEIGAGLTHVAGKAVYTWDVSGTIDPAANIARLELRSDTTTTPVMSGGGYFFGQFPATTPGPQQGAVSMPPGRWQLVGLDAAGDEVAHVDLVALYRSARPH